MQPFSDTKGKIALWVSEMIMTEYLGTVTLQVCAFLTTWSLLIESFIFGGRGLAVLLMDLRFHNIPYYFLSLLLIQGKGTRVFLLSAC